MDNSWQSQCGSIWPSSTPTVASSQQLQSQESWNQMLNAGHHFYPRIVQEPHSSARGVMPEHTFPSSSTLSFYNPGHAELASSFLSLLSGPPSALQSGLQQLSNPKPLNASSKPPTNSSNLMVNPAGTRVSPTGILSQNLDNWNPKSRIDLCPVVSRPSQSSQKVLLESNTRVPRQSSTLTSGCPRVFCLGASGDLLLSNTGLLGVVCSCHGLNMSVSKFSEHSGLRDVNSGDAVHMDNGETIAQWRQVYFHKFGIRVPDDHSGWDWPEGFSTSSASTLKSSATVPNNPSGALLTRQNNVEISNNPQTGQQLVNEVLRNEKQRNTQDGWNFLNSFIGTFHQIDGSPLFGCSTAKKLVGFRGPENGYVGSISKNGNTLNSFPHLQNLKSHGKDADVIRFYNSQAGGTVERPAVSSNIELRLGQPSQQSQTLGKSNLPAFGSHIITRDHYPQKSPPLEQMIHNGSYRDKEEHRQYFQFTAGTSKSNTRREQTHLTFVNNTSGVYCSKDAVQTEQLQGDLTRGSVLSMLLPPKATDNVVNGSRFKPGKLLSESHNFNCDPLNFMRNRSNGAETQFNVGSLGTLRHEDKGKGVEFPAAGTNFPTEFNFGFHENQKGNQCSSARIDKNPQPFPLSDLLTDAAEARNPFNYVAKNSSLGRINSTLDSGLILSSQAVTMGVSSHMTSVSVPNGTPTLSNKEGIEVSPYLLNGNFGMLALKHMLELSNQDHPISSLGTSQEHRNSSNVYVDKIRGSTVTDKEIQRQRNHDPCPNEHPLLRLGRSENNVKSSTGHGERCQRVQYACCKDNCSCAVHTNPLGRNAAQTEVLNIKNKKKVACQAFQWRDVPSKVTSKDPPADLFDVRANLEDQIAASSSKCFNRSAQNAEFLKEQEMSNVSSGCSAPAITQASLKISNEDSCTVDARDNRRTDDLVVDESSGIDKCWSSDDGLDSERSTYFEDDIASKIKSTNKGSFKAFPHQSSRSLIDELRFRDSLRSKKIRNQIHGGPSFNENSNQVPKTEKGSKIRHRKKAPKWKLLDASFPSSFVSSDCNESTDFIRSDEGRSHDCACSAKPNFKRRRSTVSSSKTVSHKRNLHRLYCDKEEAVDCQAELHCNNNILKNCEQPSHGKRFKSVHVDLKVKNFWRQEPYSSSDDETNVNVCKRKARPLVCGKYGIISNGDTSKPAKLLSMKKILQKTRIYDKSTSAKELKNKRHKRKKGCSDKSFNFKEEREKEDFEYSDSDPDDEPYDKGHSMVGSCSSTRLKPKNKDVRKRSLYELTTEAEGKDPSGAKFSSMKNSNCVPKSRSSNIVKFPKNAECNAGEADNACKSTEELNLQSKSDLDALCCVCGSSDKQEINCLLECNSCLIRVHQACYGVSKVPRTNWYCRPCKTSSKNIVCVLCGYGGGAMTQALQSHNIVKTLLKNWNFERKSIPTESLEEDHLDILHSSISVLGTDSLPFIRPEPMNSSFAPMIFNSITAGVVDSSIKQWVHMVCGLWTPGTRCPNVDTMSTFDVSGAPHPKANTVCSMCNRLGGSCIRCRVLDCSVLFHPWCAHQKGLLQSEVEGVDNENVGFYGRCELHATQNQHNSHHNPIQIVTNHPNEKELTCARTEGYKGRKRDGFRYNNPRKSEGAGGCLVPQEQVNAWVHINGLKLSTKGLPKLTHSDVEHDCRKEYARYRQSKAWKHLVVYKSGIHALGLYTSQFISRGAMVVEYVGEIVGLRVADKRESEYQSGRKLQYKSACYFFRIDKEHIIDATRKGGIARFVNHSCLPNCVAKVISVRTERKVVFFAERDIYPGEEITYDYHFNNEDEGKKIPCFCNSKNCRRYLN